MDTDESSNGSIGARIEALTRNFPEVKAQRSLGSVEIEEIDVEL